MEQQLLNTLLDISKNLESIPFWKDYTFLIGLLNSAAVIFIGILVLRISKRQADLEDYADVFIRPRKLSNIGAWEIQIRNACSHLIYITNMYFEEEKNKEAFGNLKFSRGEPMTLPAGEHNYYSFLIPDISKLHQSDGVPTFHLHIEFVDVLKKKHKSHHAGWFQKNRWVIHNLKSERGKNLKKKFIKKIMKPTTTNTLQAVEIGVIFLVGLLAFIVGMKQVDISDRLLRLEEERNAAVLSIEVGEYEIGDYQENKEIESIKINPVFKNTGLVPISIVGIGFSINRPDNFGRTFIIYPRKPGLTIEPGGEHIFPYTRKVAEDRSELYRLDVIYKKEPNGQEKCTSLILFRGEKRLIQSHEIRGCPEDYTDSGISTKDLLFYLISGITLLGGILFVIWYKKLLKSDKA